MPLKILIVPDKFKGTLSAADVAEAIAKGWRRVRPEDVIELLPMSDGGDGFGGVMSRLLGAKEQRARTLDASHRRCVSKWWWAPERKTAIVESAAVIGLAMLPPGRFHPFELDTFGLGRVLEAAALKGARRCLVGIGGSATNDGGFGMAHACGWKFWDESGQEISWWTDLHRLVRITAPHANQSFRDLLVAVDVQNPLLGPRGASRVYGPQKGLRPQNLEVAESCLSRLAAIAKGEFGSDYSRVPGAGAAGGLGFGLRAFMNGRLTSGFDLFAEWSGLDKRLAVAHCVITGEGTIDKSTLMGKGVSQLAAKCRHRGIPCIALAGTINREGVPRSVFARSHALTDLTSLHDAMARPAYWIERLAQRIAGSALPHSPMSNL
jgi:glycerate 2-kinase